MFLRTDKVRYCTCSDAPALSTEQDIAEGGEKVVTESNGWDDEALASTMVLGSAAVVGTTEQIRALELQEDKEMSEKVKIEETKAALAAARQGMERQAAARQAEVQARKAKSEGPAAARGTKWVPRHLRNKPIRPMGGQSAALDVADNELFPDLASADKILEKKPTPVKKAPRPKKAPVQAQQSVPAPPVQPVVDSPKSESNAKSETTKQTVTASAPAATSATPPPEKKTVTKKKKKNLSTFKKPS